MTHKFHIAILSLFILNAQSFLFSQSNIANLQLPSRFDHIVIEKLEIRDAPIGDVLRLIASQTGVNIFVSPAVDQRVSIYLQNAALKDIIRYLQQQYRFTFRIVGDIIHIDPPLGKKPRFEIHFSREKKTLDMDIEKASLSILLDSLSLVTKQNFIYEGVQKNKEISLHLTGLQYPEDVLQYFNNMGLRVSMRGNLFILEDKEENKGSAFSGTFRRKIELNTSGKLSVEVNEEPIAEIIRAAAIKLGKDIVVYEIPEGKISLNVADIGFDNLLNLALNGSGCTFRKNDNVYIIGNQKIRGIQSTRVIHLQHIKVEGIREKIPHYLLNEAELTVIKEQNSLSIVAYPNVIQDIESYLKKIDHEIPQVLIEAIVVDFDISNQRELGLKGGLADKPVVDSSGVYHLIPGMDILFKGKIQSHLLDDIMGSFGSVLKITKLPDNFFLQLKALERVGKANVKSKPHIATLNGHEAELKIGVTQYYKLKTNSYYGGIYSQQTGKTQGQPGSPYYPSETERFEKVDATVSLKLTPWISGDNEVMVEIHPDFQTPVNDLNPEVPPTIQYRSLNSTVRLRDGETIILGGLIQEIEKDQTDQVPIFGDIPLLGALFRSKTTVKQKKEMVIYVTPHLYKRTRNAINAYTNILFPD